MGQVMLSIRVVRGGTPLEVSVLAVMSLVLGAGCLAVAAFPMASGTPRDVILGIGLCTLAVALALLLAGPAVRPVHLHLAVALLVILRGVMVAEAATERGLMLSALGFTWTAVYVAFFLRPAAARAYAGLMTVTLGVALLAAQAPTDLSVWVTICTMVWVAVAILTRLNGQLRAEAHTDSLTGLLNRAGFDLAATRQRAMSRRQDDPVALAVIDLDAFKGVNDRGGHAAGDRLLVDLGRAWTAALRPGDLLARFGGDEFVLLMPGVAEDQIDRVLDRLARAHPTSWTAGAVVCAPDESLDLAIDRADQKLYLARQDRETARSARSGPHALRSSLAERPLRAFGS
jgi:diguanylate cyclase (GGDEF)-like protein